MSQMSHVWISDGIGLQIPEIAPNSDFLWKWLRNSAFRWSDTYLLIFLPFFENMAQQLLRIMPVLSNWLRNYSDFFLGNYQDLWWADTGITQNIASLEKMTQNKLRNLLGNIVRDNSGMNHISHFFPPLYLQSVKLVGGGSVINRATPSSNL